MKRCIICGARAPGATCDSVCTRARKNGVSREDQMRRDMERSACWSQRQSGLGRYGRWSSLAFSASSASRAAD